MLFIINMLNKHIGSLFVGALLIGLLFQPIAVFFHPFITPAVILLIGLNSLSLDTKKLISECNNYVYHLFLLFINLIVFPVVIYLLIAWVASFEPLVLHSFAIGSLLINCVPVAASGPAMIFILQGNFERASLNMLLSYVFVTVTIPVVFLLLGVNLQASALQVFSYTALIILPVIIVAILVKRFFSSYIDSISLYLSPVSILLLVVIILGCPVGVDKIILDDWEHALVAILISMIIYILLGIVGWFCAKPTVSDRLTSGILFYSKNIGLSILFAHAWFKDYRMVVFYITLSVVPCCIITPMANFWIKQARKRDIAR